MMLKKINLWYTIILCLLLIKTNTDAQQFTITAEANPAKITLSETVRYLVKVTGTTQTIPNPQLPEFQDFIVLQYLPVSHQIFQSGTTIEISKTTGAVLKPTKVGTFTIPPPTVIFNNKTYSGNSVTVEVVKESVDILPRELAELNIISATTDNAQVNKWLNGRLFI
ncbi:MAG: BatD family protein, partial [Candidatus Sumerlaeia bacterium]|nr:BatD family protein [Candidatus Sumerlaeia bacterium]